MPADILSKAWFVGSTENQVPQLLDGLNVLLHGVEPGPLGFD